MVTHFFNGANYKATSVDKYRYTRFQIPAANVAMKLLNDDSFGSTAATEL